MGETSNLWNRPWPLGAAVLGFAMLVVYLTLIAAQGGDSFFDVFAWALLMATAAVIAFASVLVAEPRIARNLLIGAAGLYGVIGVVSILSIVVGFLLAAAAASTASNP